jgi:hypothetical protein
MTSGVSIVRNVCQPQVAPEGEGEAMATSRSHIRGCAAARGLLAPWILVALGACSGGSATGSSPPPGVAANAADGGADTTPDGGATGGGAGGGPTDGGVAGGPGGGSGGVTDGGVAGGGAGDGGAPADPCAGLLPSFGDTVEVTFGNAPGIHCNFGTSNPDGQLALGFFDRSRFDAVLYSTDGEPQGAIDGALQPQFNDTLDVDPWFHWTSLGYHGIVHVGAAPGLPLRAWDVTGATIATSTDQVFYSAPDGQGGSVALGKDVDLASGAAFPTHLAWVDARGATLRAVTLEEEARVVMVNFATGHAVAITRGPAARARWFDGIGTPLTPWFDLGAELVPSTVHLLLDGTVVVNDGGTWDVALSDGVGAPGVVPAWLAARPNTRLAGIRGGRGYAVLPFDPTPARFEVVTAAGQSCGVVTLPPPSGAFRLSVGQDGTLIELHDVQVPSDPQGACVFRWWPALLR